MDDEGVTKSNNARLAAVNEEKNSQVRREEKEKNEAEEAAKRQRYRDAKARQQRDDFIRNIDKSVKKVVLLWIIDLILSYQFPKLSRQNI